MPSPSSVRDQNMTTPVWLGTVVLVVCMAIVFLSEQFLPVNQTHGVILDTLRSFVTNPWGYAKPLLVSLFAFWIALRISNF